MKYTNLITKIRILFPKYKNINLNIYKNFLNDECNTIYPSWLYNYLTGIYLYIINKYFKRIIPNISDVSKNSDSIVIRSDSTISRYTELNSLYANNPNFDLLIIGSYADKTETIESDLDTVVILKQNAFDSFKSLINTKKHLQKLNLLSQQIDPLQHHGHWLFFWYEFNNYDQSIMPICVLENAIAIGKELKLKYTIDKKQSITGFKNILYGQVNTIEKLFIGLYNEGLNFFDLKTLISSITLSLVLLFQIKDTNVRKETAIYIANQILSEKSLKMLIFATDLRVNWEKLPINKLYERVRSLSYILDNRKKLEKISRMDHQTIKMEKLPIETKPDLEDFKHFIAFVKGSI